jgi:phage protein D
MPDGNTLISQCHLKIDGTLVSTEFNASLAEVTVENSLHMPDVATVILSDPTLHWIDSPLLAPGKALEVSTTATAERSRSRPVFDGEIVELEPEFGNKTHRLTIRAFDRLHRLARGKRVRSFQNVTDSDVANRLAKEAGLTPDIESTRQVHDYLFQNNETNLEFLRRRATAVGFLLYVEGKKLCFRSLAQNPSPVSLNWGASLSEFRLRMTTVSQVNQVTVRGWDPDARQEIIAEAPTGSGMRSIGEKSSGGVISKNAFRIDAPLLVADQPVRDQVGADRAAKAIADRNEERFIEAEGSCGGNPAIVAGSSVKVDSIGSRFGGTYFVTSATHLFTAKDGYSTQFAISGQTPATLLRLLQRDEQPAARTSLVIGVVTDNQDPQGWGRVKVKYPWLTDDHASDWARVVIVGGGPQRGLEFLPEIQDEVLVGFEMGDIRYPYVLGGLWNGKDAPPKKNQQIISGGRVQQRVIQSRAGHTVVLDDSDAAASITITDKSGNQMKFDSTANEVSLESKGNLTVQAQGSLTLKASAEVTIQGAVIKLN